VNPWPRARQDFGARANVGARLSVGLYKNLHTHAMATDVGKGEALRHIFRFGDDTGPELLEDGDHDHQTRVL
jgi:hypothetical protein